MPVRRGKLLRSFAIVVLASIALLGLLQTFQAGRVATVRSYVRLERLWSRDLPIPSASGWIRALEPTLSAIGLVGPVRVEVEPGVSLLLDPADEVARTVLVSRSSSWEPEVWGAIASGLSPGAVFLDVGAYIGYDSIKAAKVVGASGRVISFEPNPTTLEILRGNISASAAQNIVVQPIALADAEQELTLYDSRATGNSGSSSLSARNAGSEGLPYQVKGRRLDNVVQEMGLTRVDVIKADIEGAEFLALSGAVNTLQRFLPKLVLEVVPGQLENMGASVEKLEGLLKSVGYNKSAWVDYKNMEFTAAP